MSLFDLEKRIDFPTEVARLTTFIKGNDIACTLRGETFGERYYVNIFTYIDVYFIKWESRGLAFNPQDYFSSISIFNNDPNAYNNLAYGEWAYEDYLLYYLEFLLNQIHFLFTRSDSILKIRELSNSGEILIAIIDNIKNLLDNINYTYDINEETNRITVRKRDSQLDAAVNKIEDRDIVFDLLSYLDHRNEDNIKEKTAIIANIYKYFEKETHINTPTIKYKENKNQKDIDLLSDFNFICNEFNMRHWPKNIHKKTGTTNIPDEEMLELLDICYYLGLQIINSNHIVNNNKTVQNYKQKYGFIK